MVPSLLKAWLMFNGNLELIFPSIYIGFYFEVEEIVEQHKNPKHLNAKKLKFSLVISKIILIV
jgi:hypothetical protein